MSGNILSLFKSGANDPETQKFPIVSKNYETNIKGLYIIGELSGIPLIKTALNNGHDIIEKLNGNIKKKPENKGEYDVIIIGLGASGFSAMNECRKKGISYLLLEKESEFTTIKKFSKGKIILAEPDVMEKKSDIWFEECTKEELLRKWEKHLKAGNYNYKLKKTVTDIKKKDFAFSVKTEDGDEYQSLHVILASGKSGNPRKIGIRGEELEKVFHFLDDADKYNNKDIHIYGGGDVALEAAIMLSGTNNVTLSTIDVNWIFPKKRNRDKADALIKEGSLKVNFQTRVCEIKEDTAVLEEMKSGKRTEIKNDVFFTMIGQSLPTAFFKKVGIKLNNTWDVIRYLKLIAGMVLAFAVYAFAWQAPPFNNASKWLAKLFVSAGGGTWWLKDTFFWYAALYTFMMIAFGIGSLKRWGSGKGRKYTYQRIRLSSLLFFQGFFFFIFPYFIINHPDITSKSFRLFYAWPLKYDAFFGTSTFWLIYAIVLAFLIIPLFVLYHGKRYCTWVCACGGLAETFADRWRHLAPKGKKSRKWEFMGLIVLLYTIFIVVWVISTGQITGAFKSNSDGTIKLHGYMFGYYLLITVFGLTSIIPVGLYPVLGGKIWCRYWCPLAKSMEYISKIFAKKGISKYRIDSYDHCILCGECSKYCEVGINVMGFAKDELSFDNSNSSCIGCGICITVCPVDNLGFGSWDKNLIYKGKEH